MKAGFEELQKPALKMTQSTSFNPKWSGFRSKFKGTDLSPDARLLKFCL